MGVLGMRWSGRGYRDVVLGRRGKRGRAARHVTFSGRNTVVRPRTTTKTTMRSGRDSFVVEIIVVGVRRRGKLRKARGLV